MNTKIEIITGRKGQGKSGLAYHHARLTRFGVAIFDPNAQFSIGRVSDNPAALEDSLDSTENVVVYRSTHNVEDDFAAFFECIWRRRELAVVVDEASLLGSPQRIDENLDKLVRLGRTKELDIFLTAHRPQDMNGIVFSLADSYCFFHTTHPRDLERIENFTSPECAARVRELGLHQFLCWSVEAEQFYVVTNPADWKEEIFPARETRISEEVLDNGE
jgi:hypothetical protein